MPDSPGEARRSVRPRTAITACAFLGVAAVQVAVPAMRLASDSQARFGWQMFATAGSGAWFSVRSADGRVDTVGVRDYVPNPRGDIDLEAVLPRHLCRHVQGAAAVTVHRRGSTAGSSERPCP